MHEDNSSEAMRIKTRQTQIMPEKNNYLEYENYEAEGEKL